MTRWFLLLLLAAGVCLSGCTHKAGWLYGKWVFDEDYTREKFDGITKAVPTGGKEDLFGGLKDLANGMVGSQLSSILAGSQFRVTDKELIVTRKEGDGKAYAYEVLDKPDADTVTLKLSDGDVNTYHREGERVWIASSGALNMRSYFKRAK
jgi:hypothetical protein